MDSGNKCPPPRETDMPSAGSDEQIEKVTDYGKALSHRVRLEILEILARKQDCVCGEIVDEVSVAQSTVSQHLKVLKKSGLIRGTVEGPQTCYCLEPRAIDEMHRLMRRVGTQGRPKQLLFLCVANSARSQMAEGLARDILPSYVTVQSAGSNPTSVNPFAIDVLDEIGIDISSHLSTPVEEVQSESIDMVVTLCCKEEACPHVLDRAEWLSWPLSDPDVDESDYSADKKRQIFRETRDTIQRRLRDLKQEVFGGDK